MSITADQLVVAVSSRALFDLEKEHQLFEKEGYEAFKDYQVEHCDDPLQPGVAFPFVKRLIGLNAFFPDLEPFRVVALSRNSPVTVRRFFNSCRHYNLPIDAGAFTSGQSTLPYISAFKVSLFLSANAQNVTHAIEAGLPGGLVLPGQMLDADEDDKTLRIASHLTLTVCLPTTRLSVNIKKRGSRPSKNLNSKKLKPLMHLDLLWIFSLSCLNFKGLIHSGAANPILTSNPLFAFLSSLHVELRVKND